MAELAAEGRIDEFRRLVSGSLRVVFFLGVPSAAAMIALAGPMLRLLWKTGKMGEAGITMSEFCLLYYAVSLIGISALQILNRAFYSLKDVRTPALVGIGYTLLIAAGTIALMRAHSPLQYAGIAAATSVGVTIGMAATFWLLRKRLGRIDGGVVAASLARIVAASALAAVAAYFVSAWTGQRWGLLATRFWAGAPDLASVATAQQGSIARVGAQVVASLAVGMATYLLALSLMGAPEIATFRSAIHRRLSARTQTAPIA
jgi:peptidoglycan biosynthesis protein MviN/MurJ (putative lipid II flippase)